MLRRLTAGVCLMLAGAAVASACPAIASAAGSHASVAREVLRRLNVQRRAHGVPPLRAQPALRRAAARHARDLVARRYFAHVSPDGATVVDRLRRSGYLRSATRWREGENLGWGAGARARPRAIVAAWMASPEHRRNLLDPGFRDVGIGLAVGAPVPVGGPAATYVTDFGSRD